MSDGQIITFSPRLPRHRRQRPAGTRSGGDGQNRPPPHRGAGPAGPAGGEQLRADAGRAWARGIDAELNRRIGPYTWDAVIANGRTVVDIDSWAFHAAQGAHASDHVHRRSMEDQRRLPPRVGAAAVRDSCIMFALKAVLDQIADTVAFRRAACAPRTAEERRSTRVGLAPVVVRPAGICRDHTEISRREPPTRIRRRLAPEL